MPRSTASFIPYDLRPSKQSERRILLDFLKIAGDCGLPITDYRYVGMGGNRFYDFLLIHRYVGIRNMISLEHDPDMHKRAVFNVPYDFIDVVPKSAAEFIAEDAYEGPSLLWLDYDGGISQSVVNDIASLSTKLKIGDFCFVTVASGPPAGIGQQNATGRLAWFQDELGEIAGNVLLEDVQTANFRNAFSVRRDGGFVPFLQVWYKDSVPMITVGGGLLAEGQAVPFRRHMARVIPFLTEKTAKLYQIKFPHLTDRERALFDRAVTKSRKRSTEYNQIRNLGFDEGDLTAYAQLIRYLPRYFETIV